MATSLLRCGTAAARSASTCPLKNVKVTALAINLTSPHRCQLHSLHTPANICASENRIFGKTSRYFSMATRLFQVSSDQAHAESDSEAEGTPEGIKTFADEIHRTIFDGKIEQPGVCKMLVTEFCC